MSGSPVFQMPVNKKNVQQKTQVDGVGLLAAIICHLASPTTYVKLCNSSVPVISQVMTVSISTFPIKKTNRKIIYSNIFSAHNS